MLIGIDVRGTHSSVHHLTRSVREFGGFVQNKQNKVHIDRVYLKLHRTFEQWLCHQPYQRSQ